MSLLQINNIGHGRNVNGTYLRRLPDLSDILHLGSPILDAYMRTLRITKINNSTVRPLVN